MEGSEHILDRESVEDRVGQYFGNLLSGEDLAATAIAKTISSRQKNTLAFSRDEILAAIKQTNFQKSLGPDGFDGQIMKDASVKEAVADQLASMLTNGHLPSFFKSGRLVLLSKKTSKSVVPVEETRPIVVNSHLYKICEKAILNKLKSMKSGLLHTGDY